MDCRTARQLLDFARPGGYDLAGDDRSALEFHLAHCPECDSLARAQRHFDDHLGRAIRDVPVPQGLQQRVLTRLRQDRDDWWRQTFGRLTRYVAAAAAVLLLVYSGFSLWQRNQPRVPGEEAVRSVEETLYSPPDRHEAERFFARKGLRVSAPDNFQYVYLRAYNITSLNQRRVPYLLFVRPGTPAGPAAVAEVYILPGAEFDLSEFTDAMLRQSGDRFKVRIDRPAESKEAYVIVYTGPLEDLRVSDQQQ